MKNSIERAMDQIDFGVQVDPDKFARMNRDDQDLFVESLSEREKWTLFRHFKLNHDGKLEWRGDEHD